MKWQDLIEERPEVMMGKPVFKGTRITVEHVLHELGTGMDEAELLRGHPRLTREHLQAAMLPRGLSGRELIDALRQSDIRWEGPPGELERLLAEVQVMREEDLEFPGKPSPFEESHAAR